MRNFLDYIVEHKKLFLIMFGLLIANILFFSFFTMKEYNLYHNTEAEIKKVEKELKQTKKRYFQLSSVVKNVKEAKKTIANIKKKKLRILEDDFPRLTGRIYDILKSHDVIFQHISYNKKKLKGLGIIKIVIHIPMKTTYYNFRRVLNELENIPFPVAVERISVNAVEANSISATVDMVVYYRGTK